jgi:hypothetical protein
MNLSTPEEQFAELKQKYLDELNLEENIKLIVNDPDIDKTKIQSYIIKIDNCKLRRKDVVKEMKELVTIFPRLTHSLDHVRDLMLKEAEIPDEKVEFNVQYQIRRMNEVVQRLYRKPPDVQRQDNIIQDNKIRHRILRLDIQKQRIIRELQNNVEMSDFVRNKHKEHVNKIEQEQDNLIHQLKILKINKVREPTREDELKVIYQKILNIEKQIGRLTADAQNLENSCVDFDRDMHFSNINRISKEQEALIDLYKKLKSKPQEDNINKFRIEKEREDNDSLTQELHYIEQKIEKLETEKQKLIAELKNTVLMNNSDRHIINDRISRIEQDQKDLTQEYKKLEHKQKGDIFPDNRHNINKDR